MSATRHLLLALAFLLLAIPGTSFAQSACTAMWGTIDNDGASGGGTAGSLRYYNTKTNRWVDLSPAATLSGNPNAIGGDPGTGILYYVDRTGLTLRSYNLNTGVEASVGLIGTTSLPGGIGAAAIVGATFTGSGQLFLYLTENAGTNREYVGRVNLTTPANTTWTQILTLGGGVNPTMGTSGDMYTTNGGASFIASNTTPNTLWSIDLNPLSGTYARTTQTLVLSTSLANLWGIAVNPLDGLTYIGSNTNGSVTFLLNTTSGAATLLDNNAVYGVTDMGNCVSPPAAPSVTKSFSPTFKALGGSTTTLVIAISNSNTVPTWLNGTFTDVLPTGMVIGPIPSLNAGTCAASGTVTNVFTATAGANTFTFAPGGRIPASGCTITFAVSATASVSAYTNTIPAGSLTTTAGTNTVAASATYKVGTDFSVTKLQGTGTSGPYTSGAQTSPGSQTMQYVLTITNSTSGGTGSATFTDTLPSLVTPVLSITAGVTGGGSCSTASAVLNGATVVTGTLTNVTAGGVCTVTVTTKVSATQTVATAVTNTLTVAPTPSTSDTSATNNTATVATTIGASANITVAKNNGLAVPVAAGTSVTYTITVVNSGPSQASGTLVKDPSSTGLSCFTVNCTSTAGATCPAASFPYTNMTAGVSLTPFASGSTATFVVSCGVTATGLP